MRPILYPVQVVTGGGRAKGFAVEKYLPWATLPALKQTEAWDSIVFLYDRLGTAYDCFYEVLGFLSPKIRAILQELQESYGEAYLKNQLPEYAQEYSPTQPLEDIVKPYGDADYPSAYAHLLTNQILGGVLNERL